MRRKLAWFVLSAGMILRQLNGLGRFVAALVATMSEAYMMQERRQLRRSKLAEGIRRRRHLLSALAALKKTPMSVEIRAESHIQEISDELRKMEDELHELNVQQIREESSSG
jgi:hypothetical protein